MIKRNITFPKGDSKLYKIRITLAGGVFLSPVNYGDLILEVRKTPCDEPILTKKYSQNQIVFDEKDSYYRFTFSPNDTEEMERNFPYEYKIRFVSVASKVYKTLVSGVFELTD